MKRALTITAWIMLFGVLGCQIFDSTLPTESISGFVLDETGKAIANAVVRVKATEYFTITDIDGYFTFTNLNINEPYTLTAWAYGYYINGVEYNTETISNEIVLRKHYQTDNADYQWISAFSDSGDKESCENCHADSQETALPFTEWKQSAHAHSAENQIFLTMYLGQDVNGNQSPLRNYGFNQDYGQIPLRADLSQPYFGPGYKLDFPETEGNCAACHTPVSAINAPYETNPTQITGVGEEGITCDFCHKVFDIRIDKSTNLPFQNMPGVLSFEFRRPPQGYQFFAGPFDDVDRGKDTFSPIQSQSQFCAACHFGSFWDVQIYNSFGEWLESPYNNSETGKTCQDCHMSVGNNDHFARLDEGGVIRDPQKISSHLITGASDIELLQNSVTMTADTKIQDNKLIIEVKITNDKTGHHVPTDSPLRQMILLVKATDEKGGLLTLLEGETIPEWGGIGESNLGYYRGLPGKGFAKILSELWTELEPTGSYWNPTQIVSDNRIPAFGTDSSIYIFTFPSEGKVNIEISLLFRRAFKELMDQKGWNVPDILMEQLTIAIDRE